MKLSNEHMHGKHTQKEMYASLLARLPKFSGSQNPDAFINALEKQLVDRNISVDWLNTPEPTLEGNALTNYWSLLSADEKSTYAAAKAALLGCMGAVTISKVGSTLKHVPHVTLVFEYLIACF